LVQPSSWRRMGLRWTATATSMSARCRGPTGRKLSETSHGRISCARCTSSGRWYKKSPRNSLLLYCEISAPSMSVSGQERTSTVHLAMSALPLKADIAQTYRCRNKHRPYRRIRFSRCEIGLRRTPWQIHGMLPGWACDHPVASRIHF
jgi:hypothetical protein